MEDSLWLRGLSRSVPKGRGFEVHRRDGLEQRWGGGEGFDRMVDVVGDK